MPSLFSRRPVLGLFALTALSCGAIFFAGRLKSFHGLEMGSALVWKNSAFATQVAFSPDGRTITTLGDQCKRFDARTGRLLSGWTSLYLSRLTPDGQSVIYFDSDDGFLRRSQGGIDRRRHSRAVIRTGWAGVGMLSALNAKDRKVLWHHRIPNDGSEVHDLSHDYLEVSNDFIWLKPAGKLGAPDHAASLNLFSRATGKKLRSIAVPFEISSPFDDSWIFDGEGNLLYAKKGWRPPDGAPGDFLELKGSPQTHRFDLQGTQRKNRLNDWQALTFDNQFENLAGTRYRPDGTTFAGELAVWNDRGTLLWSQEVPGFRSNAVRFSPDGRYIALGGDDLLTDVIAPDGRILVYEVNSGRMIANFQEVTLADRAKRRLKSTANLLSIPGFTSSVQALAWSPDSKRLAATYVLGGLRVWKVE